MGVSFEDPSTFPVLVPIPQFDCHVIGAGQYKRLSWMNDNAANVTRFGVRATLESFLWDGIGGLTLDAPQNW